MSFGLKLPGSTSNLGPGFDVLGLALGIHNHVTVEAATSGPTRVTIEGEGQDQLPTDDSNLFVQAATETASTLGQDLPPLRVQARNEIPLARGLGSSSTAIVGGVLAANRLFDDPLDEAAIVSLATRIEGHPDNVSPCILGGLTIASTANTGEVTYVRALPADGLEAVVAVPDFEIRTEDARNALPDHVPHGDAVFNTGNACLVTAALLTGKVDILARAMEDRLHQPYRADLIRGYDDVCRAARDAGALNVAISGAGPTLFALTTSNGTKVAHAMANAWKKHDVTATPRVLPIDTVGAVYE